MTGSGNNTYLVIGSDRSGVLIDAGVGHPLHQAELARALQAHDARLARVLVTHGHADHSSGAGQLASNYPGVRVQKFPSAEMDTDADIAWEPLHDGEEILIGDLAERILSMTNLRVTIASKQAPNDPIERRCPDLSRARALLGFEPRVGLDEGLRLTLAWYARSLELEPRDWGRLGLSTASSTEAS
jgi:hypothetical protein